MTLTSSGGETTSTPAGGMAATGRTGDDQIFLRTEVAKERTFGHPGLVGDVPHRRLRYTVLSEQPVRGLLQRLPRREFVRLPASEWGRGGRGARYRRAVG